MSRDTPLPDRLVIFDGVCGLCDRTVQFLLDHDTDRSLYFTTMKGTTAARVRARHPELEGVDSIAFVERSGDSERVYLRSRAVFRIATYLDPGVRWLRVFGVVPERVADLGYDLVASLRYRFFGKLEACRVPDPSVRERFLG
ncbi:MAG: DUF393 domain-containing protein [Myxococcales bacterium]|nr:DUF393 domain-containing protein [Myxococcales bacterium]